MEQQCSENILTLLPSKESKLQEQRTGDQDNCIYLIHPSVFPPYESTTKLLKAEAQETQSKCSTAWDRQGNSCLCPTLWHEHSESIIYIKILQEKKTINENSTTETESNFWESLNRFFFLNLGYPSFTVTWWKQLQLVGHTNRTCILHSIFFQINCFLSDSTLQTTFDIEIKLLKSVLKCYLK